MEEGLTIYETGEEPEGAPGRLREYLGSASLRGPRKMGPSPKLDTPLGTHNLVHGSPECSTGCLRTSHKH